MPHSNLIYSQKIRQLLMRSSERMFFRFFILMALSFVLSGCSESPTLIGEPKFVDSRATVSHEEVLNILAKRQQFVLDNEKEFFDLIDSVQNEADVEHFIRQLRRIAGKLRAKSMPNPANQLSVKMNDEEYENLLSAIQESNKSSYEKREAQFAARKSSRVQGSKSHIEGFGSLEMQSLIGEIETLSRSIEEGMLFLERLYPDETAVIVFLESSDGSSELMRYLSEKSEAADVFLTKHEGKPVLRFAPIEDIEAFANNIDLGTTSHLDIDARELYLELSDVDLKQLKSKIEQIEAEEKRIAEQKKQREIRGTRKERLKDLVVLLGERQQLLKSCADHLQRMTNIQATIDAVEAVQKLCEDYRDVQKNLREASEDDEHGNLTPPAEYQDRAAELIKKMEAEIARLSQDPKQRALLTRHFGQNLTAKRLLETKPPFHGFANPAEDRSHPDFVAANLVDLLLGDTFEREHALERLAKTDPMSVKDSQLRKEIARTIRDIALAHNGSGSNEAIQPLAKWAGKYSVPILIELLDRGVWFSQQEEVITILGKYPTEDGARAVAKFVGELGEHELACQTLLSMDSIAEAAVMEIAPSDDPDVSLAAVTLLGEIGTPKSLSLLKQARSSTNQQVKRAASEATKKIVQRSKQQEKSAKKEE